ncbi:MAG: HAD-IC family P-type ATPase [Marmoricola sp.]
MPKQVPFRSAVPDPTAVATDHAAAPHSVPVGDLVSQLETDRHRGLEESVAVQRLGRDGPNMLPRVHGDSLARRVLLQFHNPLIYVLLASAATTLVLREYVDSSVILGVVLINALVGFIQESKALAALDSLRSMAHGEARVVRAGLVRAILSEDLVSGDLVALEPGEKVPADLRLVEAVELRVDESSLTGESASVRKTDDVLTAATRVADRRNMTYAGTLVRSGTGHGIVVATGERTELGGIHRLVSGATVLATPLTSKLARFSTRLSVIILALAAAAFVIGVLRGESAADMFTAVVALAVGAIPEGLPAAVTITLAIGVKRMVSRRAVVRRLPAVETLGSTTVICTDKTGTLTTNEMTVRDIWTPDGQFEVTGRGYDPAGQLRRAGPQAQSTVKVADNEALRWCLTTGSACNDASISHDGERWTISGDPTEAAMKVVALKSDVGPVDEDYPRVDTIPFDSRRQFMATLHRRALDGRRVVLVKGAAERVTELCSGWMRADGTVETLNRAAVVEAVAALAARGLRVLATAVDPQANPTDFTAEGLDGHLVLCGLQAMLDPPRPAASTSIAACHAAGIEIKMITGDHADTAAAIAEELGLDHRPVGDHRVITGEDLSALDESAYIDAVTATSVFARVSPEEKLRLVESLQARGHVVAMTGDGVNDAPALRQADIGIAMGRGGTDVAKDAADMILVDDDFATIEAAVEEGRGVFDNLTKFIVWTLPTNMGEGLVILVAIVLGSTLPILPTQILWINMTTAVVLGLMLAFEPREEGVMTRPPRAPDRPLLTATLIWRTALVSSLLVLGTWWVFVSEQARGEGLEQARTAAVNLFVAVEIVYLYSCRSLTGPSWRLGFFSNRWIIGGVLVQACAQAAFTYLPLMNQVFDTAPIGTEAWSRILLAVAGVSLVIVVDKFLAVRRVKRRLLG